MQASRSFGDNTWDLFHWWSSATENGKRPTVLSIFKQVKILLFGSAQRRVGSLGLSMGEFQQ